MQQILGATLRVSGIRHQQRHVCGPAQQAARMVRPVASMENVSTQMEQDSSFDKEEAYRIFEEMIGDADVTFDQGDKVSEWRLLKWRGRVGGSNWLRD